LVATTADLHAPRTARDVRGRHRIAHAHRGTTVSPVPPAKNAARIPLAHRCAPAVRFFTRGIRLRTLRDMRRAIDDFDAIVTRAFKRLPRDLRGGVLVMTFARKMVWAALNLAPAAEAADTS